MDEIRFKSPEEVHNYVRKLAERKWEEDPTVSKWRTFKQGARLLILIIAYLQYFIIDLTNQALRLSSIVFNIPPPPMKHSLILVSFLFT